MFTVMHLTFDVGFYWWVNYILVSFFPWVILWIISKTKLEFALITSMQLVGDFINLYENKMSFNMNFRLSFMHSNNSNLLDKFLFFFINFITAFKVFTKLTKKNGNIWVLMFYWNSNSYNDALLYTIVMACRTISLFYIWPKCYLKL